MAAWDHHVLTTISRTGHLIASSLDPRSSMASLLRQDPRPQPWSQRAIQLATAYRRAESEGHRLLLLAVSHGWLALRAPLVRPTLALREVLSRTALLGDARLAALDRRLPTGRCLLVEPFARDLTEIGWLNRTEASFLERLSGLALWHWR